jgi:hypothetical protein
MNVTDYVVAQLATLDWREGKRMAPGNRDAMLGIAHVIHNRVLAGWHAGDWLKIIDEFPMHSASNLEEHDFRSIPDLMDPDFRWLAPQVERVYSGALRDTVTALPSVQFAMPRVDALGRRPVAPPPQSALFYCDLNRVTRAWFAENILSHAVRDQHPILSHSLPVTFVG